jgi:hypothetical protein
MSMWMLAAVSPALGKPALKTITPVHMNEGREGRTLERLIDLVEEANPSY